MTIGNDTRRGGSVTTTLSVIAYPRPSGRDCEYVLELDEPIDGGVLLSSDFLDDLMDSKIRVATSTDHGRFIDLTATGPLTDQELGEFVDLLAKHSGQNYRLDA